MNLLLLYPSDLTEGGRYVVEDGRARHLVAERGAEPEQIVHVGLLNGPRGRARVVSAAPERLELEPSWDPQSAPPPRRRLLLAVPRPKVLKRLYPQLAALGVTELVLMRTWRVERSYLQADALTPEVYRPLLHEGMMQACFTHEPVVRVEPRFMPFVERLEGGDNAWIADPRGPGALELEARPGAGFTLALGPDRGFLDEEVARLEQAGLQRFSLGAGVLRLETACIAALAQLELVTRAQDGSQPSPRQAATSLPRSAG